jgi:hypothetical protein
VQGESVLVANDRLEADKYAVHLDWHAQRMDAQPGVRPGCRGERGSQRARQLWRGGRYCRGSDVRV